MVYEVGGCEGDDGRVESKVSVTLKNDLGFGQRPPAYMVGKAEEDETGPVNVILAQFHLPNGAELVGVTRDGEQVGYAEFTEQGRSSLVLSVTLPPRDNQELVVTFREPDVGDRAEVDVQPLALPQTTEVVDAPC